jgi:hypothetical protein
MTYVSKTTSGNYSEEQLLAAITAVSWECEKTITALCSVSASGNYIPPMITQEAHVLTVAEECTIGVLYACFQNWWITEELFCEWPLHFKQFAKPSKDKSVLITRTPIKN